MGKDNNITTYEKICKLADFLYKADLWQEYVEIEEPYNKDEVVTELIASFSKMSEDEFMELGADITKRETRIQNLVENIWRSGRSHEFLTEEEYKSFHFKSFNRDPKPYLIKKFRKYSDVALGWAEEKFNLSLNIALTESLSEDLKYYWVKKGIDTESNFYNSKHEIFFMAGFKEKDFPKLVETLKNSEKRGAVEVAEFSFTIHNGTFELKCITFDPKHIIMDKVKEAFPENATYWQDIWEHEDDIILDPSTCEVSKITITDLRDNEPELEDNYWDVRLVVKDKDTNAEWELGGGYLTDEQKENIVSLANDINRKNEIGMEIE